MKADLVYKKLISNGFFPEKLEGIFSAKKFGEWIILNNPEVPQNGRYHLVIYKATRNDNAPRIFGIPNPVAHLNTSIQIRDNWKKIEEIYEKVKGRENISMIIPKDGNKNQRLVSLSSYDSNKEKEYLETKKHFGKKYFVHADVASCYPNIYTHSICWALVGKNRSKLTAQKKNLWYNKIDQSFQSAQDKETKGIPIGPDTSGIVAELILSCIDRKLSKKYEYNRFIDDYYCFCETKEKAEHFIKDLSFELDFFRLSLNTKKTKISSLPKALNESWVRKLRSLISWKKIGKEQKDAVISFLDLSSELFAENPGESSIRYAIQVIRKKNYVHYETFQLILQYYFNLCYLYPYIIDTCHYFVEIGINSFPLRKDDILKEVIDFLNKFLKEHISFRRTDAVVWAFFNAIKFDLLLENTSQMNKQTKGDCLNTLMLYLYSKINKINVVYFDQYFKDIEKDTSKHSGVGRKGDYSEMWLFVYEYSRIENKSLSIPLLEVLRNNDISFLDDSILNKL